MSIKERIEKLRSLMRQNKIDAYIVPSSDDHLSEYVAEHYKCREWISGFTGSAGTAVITLGDAGLWTDGRYFIQAEKQLEGSGIKLFKMGEPGVPTYVKWLNEILKEEATVGVDGNVFSAAEVKAMKKEFSNKKLSIDIEHDLIDELWKDRPEVPSDSIFVHEVKYAGKTRTEKLSEVRSEMKAKGANYYLLSSLDDIAWLLNIRGNDVQNNPVVVANVIVTESKAVLFVDLKKVTPQVKAELDTEGVEVKEYNEVKQEIKKLTKDDAIMIDPNTTNAALYNTVNSEVKIVEEPNITTILKAVKNKVEIENLRNCQITDGVAMVKFLKWIKTSVGKENITEISASDKLEELRRQCQLCVGLSFDTIAGYKEHAAMMHYKANEKTDYALKPEGFLLVDSGGQYYNGTTDITRTIVLGKLTEEEKRDFTLVLKSNIALDSAKFLYGASGYAIDAIARQPIWKYGLDYKCGTGHGVGFFLNVHEGPQRISFLHHNDLRLEEGMIVTDEPGIYKEGKHGIRTENMLIVTKAEKTEFGEFMQFETLTFCPIDLEGIVIEMLTEDEKQWLNDYHKKVYDKLAPHLSEDEKAWLKEQTREI